jgi:hypothetical protein
LKPVQAKKLAINKQGLVAQVCHPSYAGGIGRRIAVSRSSWAKVVTRLCLKNKP